MTGPAIEPRLGKGSGRGMGADSPRTEQPIRGNCEHKMHSTNTGQKTIELADHGLRCTRQRRAIYEVLSATTTHPTVDQIFRQVRRQIPGVSLATVYNTLEAFCQARLAVKLPGHDGPAHYDATTHNHLHTRSKNTGVVRDVPEQLSQQVLDELPHDVLKIIESRLGFKIRHVQIELVGDYEG